MDSAASVGMSEQEMWRTCPAFLVARIRAKKRNDRYALEVTRAKTYIIAKPHYNKGMTARKMWPLPTDKPIKADLIPDGSQDWAAKFDRIADVIMEQKSNGTQ